MSIKVFVVKKNSAVSLNQKKLQKLIISVCRNFKIKKAVIEIEVLGNSDIKKMNKKFFNKNRSTDCISFDLSDRNEKLFLIAVNAQMADRVARKRKNIPESELLLYILHGLLHNLGFDDSTKKTAALMHRTEDKFLHKIGLGLVYYSGK